MSRDNLFSKKLKNFEDKIYIGVESNFNAVVNRRMKRLEDSLDLLQQDFFTMMATSISGATKEPSLGAFTPMWKPLQDTRADGTPGYTENREHQMGVPEDQFFRFSGKMETTLAKLKPRTFLGKPVVTYQGQGVEQRTMKTYRRKKRDPNKPLQAKLEINLFPKLPGSIDSVNEADLFDGVSMSWITERRGNETTKTPISYRFRNFQGARDRPIVVEYLKWWLFVRARREIKRIMK